MKILRQYFTLIDSSGLVPGKEVWFYPTGTTSYGTKADEVTGKPGEYLIQIDPSADNAKISKYYDVWYDGVKQYDKVTLKDKWEWFTSLDVITTPQDVDFDTLQDENGENLPTTIPHPRIEVAHFTKGRTLFITLVDTTMFTIKASDYSDVDADIPTIAVKLKITEQEA